MSAAPMAPVPSVLRVLFAGTPEVALPALEALLADPRIEVVAALTNPDRPRGRRGEPVAPPVAVRARAAGVPVLQPERPADVVAALTALRADVAAVVAYGSLLPPEVLAATRLGFMNLHFSLLPRWRGAAPVQHAIRAGDAVTGVSVFVIDEGMDTGPLVRTRALDVPEGIESGALLELLADLGAPLLVEGLLALAAGERPVPQPEDGVTLAPKLSSADMVLDWGASAVELDRRVRSVSPRPGAVTELRGERCKVAGTRVHEPHGGGDGSDAAGDVAGAQPPGTVMSVGPDGALIACGSGMLEVARFQPAGRGWREAAELARGRMLAPGDVLGTPSVDVRGGTPTSS
jgi:methionyl-tRNA formyltransferase